MANDNLESFRKDLSDDFNSLWDDLADVISNMKREFDASDRAAFRECMTEGSRSDIVPCLEEAAEDMGVAESFRRQLNSQDELIADLRSAGRSAAESNNVSEEVRNSADFQSVAEINRMCANPNVSDSDIENKLSDDALDMVGGSISSYQDCVTASAESAGLRDSLKDAYGTA